MMTSFNWRQWPRGALLVAGMLMAPWVLTSQAFAGCIDPGTLQLNLPSRHNAVHLIPAVYHPDEVTGFQHVSERLFPPPRKSIVGLWEVQTTGIASDWGTQAWHADGTELLFSVSQDPATGDVCQGVWQQVGPRTYTLNHVAMGWLEPGANPSLGSPFVRVHLHFIVTLDPSGDKYTGTYTADIFMESKDDPFNEDPVTNPPIASGSGDVVATRVKPDPAP